MVRHNPPSPCLDTWVPPGPGGVLGVTLCVVVCPSAPPPPPPVSPRRRGDLEQQLRTVIDELGKASAKVGGNGGQLESRGVMGG